MRFLRWSVVCVLAWVAGCGGGGAVLRDPAPIYVADARPAADVRTAVLGALARRHWQPESESENRIVAVLYIREHIARVLITYDGQRVWIQYVDSQGLAYSVDRSGRQRIHPNYNRWVANLASTISAALPRGAVVAAPGAPAAPPAAPLEPARTPPPSVIVYTD